MAVSGQKSGTKTMMQLWDGVRAKTFENKIKALDEKFNICFSQRTNNASLDAHANSTKPKNATAKSNDTASAEDGGKLATMCKAEKAELMAVHDEIR